MCHVRYGFRWTVWENSIVYINTNLVDTSQILIGILQIRTAYKINNLRRNFAHIEQIEHQLQSFF